MESLEACTRVSWEDYVDKRGHRSQMTLLFRAREPPKAVGVDWFDASVENLHRIRVPASVIFSQKSPSPSHQNRQHADNDAIPRLVLLLAVENAHGVHASILHTPRAMQD